MKAFPQPDRLRHLLSRTRFGTGMETPVPQSPRPAPITHPKMETEGREELHEPAKATRFRRIARGPPHAPPRERKCDPLHPRCLPSMGFPKRVGSSARPAVSSLAAPLIQRLMLPTCSPARQRRGPPGIGRFEGHHPKVLSFPIREQSSPTVHSRARARE